MSLENMNALNKNSINLIQTRIDNKIKILKEEKDNLQKEKSNNSTKISQNDIKLKLCNDEKNNIDKRLPSISDEMNVTLTSSSASLSTSFCISSLVPTSIPRVGSSSIR